MTIGRGSLVKKIGQVHIDGEYKEDEDKEDVVSNFLKLYNGMGLFDRESI